MVKQANVYNVYVGAQVIGKNIGFMYYQIEILLFNGEKPPFITIFDPEYTSHKHKELQMFASLSGQYLNIRGQTES